MSNDTMKSNALRLIENGSATGEYGRAAIGGAHWLIAEGTWSGTTLSLQMKLPNGTALTLTGISLTANGRILVNLPIGADVRAVLTGGSPSGIYAWLVPAGDGMDGPLPTVTNAADNFAAVSALSVMNFGLLFDGTNWDRQRGNTDNTLLASAARTVTVDSGDLVNYNGRGLHVVLDVTSPGTGSITITIQGKDPLSGVYYTLLVGAAVTTQVTNVYKVYPGLTAAANAVANDILPRTFRVLVTHNNANSITYSLAASVIL